MPIKQCNPKIIPCSFMNYERDICQILPKRKWQHKYYSHTTMYFEATMRWDIELWGQFRVSSTDHTGVGTEFRSSEPPCCQHISTSSWSQHSCAEMGGAEARVLNKAGKDRHWKLGSDFHTCAVVHTYSLQIKKNVCDIQYTTAYIKMKIKLGILH